MKMSELRKRSVAAGMTSDELDSTDDNDSPKATFMDFLVRKGHGARAKAADS